MKRSNITFIIIIAGIAAAVCMLAKAFVPAVYKSLSTTVFMFAMLGAALLCAPDKKLDIKGYGLMLAVMLVISLIGFAYAKAGLFPFIRIPVFAVLAAVGMLIIGKADYALAAAVFAGAAAVYSGEDLVAFTHLSFAYCTAVAVFGELKNKKLYVKVAAAVLVCLALCAFK